MGNSASLAASRLRNAASTRCSAAATSGRRSSKLDGRPACTGGGSGEKSRLISIAAAGYLPSSTSRLRWAAMSSA